MGLRRAHVLPDIAFQLHLIQQFLRPLPPPGGVPMQSFAAPRLHQKQYFCQFHPLHPIAGFLGEKTARCKHLFLQRKNFPFRGQYHTTLYGTVSIQTVKQRLPSGVLLPHQHGQLPAAQHKIKIVGFWMLFVSKGQCLRPHQYRIHVITSALVIRGSMISTSVPRPGVE